jgi:hypothetical protein
MDRSGKVTLEWREGPFSAEPPPQDIEFVADMPEPDDEESTSQTLPILRLGQNVLVELMPVEPGDINIYPKRVLVPREHFVRNGFMRAILALFDEEEVVLSAD